MKDREKKPGALISACLTGIHCRYDGGHQFRESVRDLSTRFELVPVCPEQLGGMPTPRPPCEINEADGRAVLAGKAKVLQVEDGKDRTDNFLRGAEETMRIAQMIGAKHAFLKGGSPSCGVLQIVRAGNRITGKGVTCTLLEQHGVYTQEIE